MRSDPVGLLGAEHVERFGVSTELLVKIIDAGQRLPVHVHPTRQFARDHQGSSHGKAEAWIILEAPTDASVFAGFAKEIDRGQLVQMIDQQDSAAMLSAMNRIPVKRGESVFVPPGLPHVIGAGLLLIELQEPTDYSMLLEWTGYEVDPAIGGQLGLTGRMHWAL